MKELFKKARSPKVVWQELPYGDHNNSVAEAGYFMHVEEFLRKFVLGS